MRSSLPGFLAYAAAASVVLTLPSPQPLSAQAAATCGWHFLAPTDTPPTIGALLDRGAVAEHREAVAHLLKWYRGCDDNAGREAVRLLRRSLEFRNNDLTRAFLGVAYLRGPDIQVEHAPGTTLRQIMMRTNAEKTGARLLREVVEKNQWPEAAVELALVQAVSDDRAFKTQTATTLERRVQQLNSGAAWVALGELELSLDRYDRAAEAGARAMALHAPGGARVRGIALALGGRADQTAAATLYMDGLRDDAALHSYYDDVRFLLAPAELEEWSALTSGHAAWIAARWDWSAQLAGTGLPERLAEHHRRLRTAFEQFPRIRYRGAPHTTQSWLDESVMRVPLDDRGIVYVRLGEPRDILRMRPQKDRLPSRIAWVYDRIGASPTVYEFDVMPDRPGYFLAEPMEEACVYGNGGKVDHFTAPVVGDIADWASMVVQHNRKLGLFYSGCAWYRYLEVRTEARRIANEVLRIEDAVPRFDRPLDATFNPYAFRNATGSTEVVSYVSVDAAAVTGTAAADGVAYSLNVLVSAATTPRQPVVRKDTVLQFRLRSKPAAGAYIGAAIALSHPATADARLAVTVRNPRDSAQGQVMIATREIPSFPAGKFAMSDLVIAETRDGAWHRGSVRLAPYRGHAVPATAAFRLFSEIYGARDGDMYDVRISVTPGRDVSIRARIRELVSARQAFSVQFPERVSPSADGVMYFAREVQPSLQPGSYIVELEFRNHRTGDTTMTSTELTVVR